MSKRNEPDDLPELSPTETSKKPRVDLEEQIQRASTLAAQLRDSVKDESDSKTFAANQIAGEELMRIFENMQEKTIGTSKSVDDLISAQIRLEVHRMMDFLASPATRLPSYISIQINNALKPTNLFYRENIIQKVQELMEGFTSGDYVAIIKETVKAVLMEEYKMGTGAELAAVMDRTL